MTTSTFYTATTSNVFTDHKAAAAACKGDNTVRVVTQSFRQPARSASVIVSSAAWQQVEASTTPDAYKPLLLAVLDTAAKEILKTRLGNMALFPLTIDTGPLFTADAIMAEASGANTEWLTKEELTAAWEASATRKLFTTNERYTADKAYRAAVANFAELVLKFAGKTSSYEPKELDTVLAKMDESDLESPFGAFIIKRIEQLKAKPVKAVANLDLL